MSKAFHYAVNEFNKKPNILNYNSILIIAKVVINYLVKVRLMKINKLSIRTKNL